MLRAWRGSLQGRTALITGGGSGIGRERALLFAAEGARVVVADRDVAAGAATAEAIASAGGEAHASWATDVAVSAQVEAAVAAAEERFGALHVVFNNAGHLPRRPTAPRSTPPRTSGTA